MSPGLFVVLASLAVLGHAHWFFGNLYEATVLAPGWASMAGRPLQLGGGFLAPGSPVRYYIPATPLTALVTVAAGVAGRQVPEVSHLPLALSVVLCLVSAAVTVFIVTRVNVRLFLAPDVPPDRQAVLARRWVRLNHVRLVTVGAAGALLVWTLVRFLAA
ncbi:anthrone oxygenase family protein [Actinoplanes auranticolor]|uniref:DUF1772 domain-containing protein n=1 Tax=Actinoplanes auranticolor TaxID=47988 RepID=A0A919SSJ6_9ACTN|nr:DUF1772 domain-containing protein [Actinoplanes auranticolor]GIM78225.1 hypothetical protein Aau02nite_79830 [Actinoplanes auranticolor]